MAHNPRVAAVTPSPDRPESQHVVGADLSMTDRAKLEECALAAAALFERAVIGRDYRACIEWLSRYAGWVPEE